MPLLKIKLFEDDAPADLIVDAEAYLVAETTDEVRAMGADQFLDHDGDTLGVLAMAVGGIDTPASLTAVAAVIAVDKDRLVDAQAAVDLALSLVPHQTVTDANLDLVPNEISSASTPFTTGGEDDGRKVLIAGQSRNIVSVTSTTVAVYDGVALTGTGQTVVILGAESIQQLTLSCHKAKDRDTVFSLRAVVEGENP